jgi:MoxR-like ATPase
MTLPLDISALQSAFAARGYVADRDLATALFLSLTLGRPLLLEGEAGVGKTEVARTLAGVLGADLIRLQCYEGLDVNTAVYEWDYPRQMLEIRLLEARGEARTAATATSSARSSSSGARCCARWRAERPNRRCC